MEIPIPIGTRKHNATLNYQLPDTKPILSFSYDFVIEFSVSAFRVQVSTYNLDFSVRREDKHRSRFLDGDRTM